MRLTNQQINAIKRHAADIFGTGARVLVFGSRTDDSARGGDLYLLVSTDQPVTDPAMQAALLSTRVSRLMHGRKVDVVIRSPNLKTLPIHRIAEETGVPL